MDVLWVGSVVAVRHRVNCSTLCYGLEDGELVVPLVSCIGIVTLVVG